MHHIREPVLGVNEVFKDPQSLSPVPDCPSFEVLPLSASETSSVPHDTKGVWSKQRFHVLPAETTAIPPPKPPDNVAVSPPLFAPLRSALPILPYLFQDQPKIRVVSFDLGNESCIVAASRQRGIAPDGVDILTPLLARLQPPSNFTLGLKTHFSYLQSFLNTMRTVQEDETRLQHNPEGTQATISREAVGKLLHCANKAGTSKKTMVLEAEPKQNGTQVLDPILQPNTLEVGHCSRNSIGNDSVEAKCGHVSLVQGYMDQKEELDHSDWEDGTVAIVDHSVTIALNLTPDSSVQKQLYRPYKDKEVAEV